MTKKKSVAKADTLLDAAYMAGVLDGPEPNDTADTISVEAAITTAVHRFFDYVFTAITKEIQVQPGPEIRVKLLSTAPNWLVHDLNAELPVEWTASLDKKRNVLTVSCLTDGPKIPQCTALHTDKLRTNVKEIAASLLQLQETYASQERKKVRDAFLNLNPESLEVVIPVQTAWPQWFIISLPHCAAVSRVVDGDRIMVVQYRR